MNNANENKESNVKLIKHYIKDLSFENPQNVNELNADHNNHNSIDINMNILHETYKNNHFSLILHFILDCRSKKNNKQLCHLELDYFGFFKAVNKDTTDEKVLTEHALNLIFPFSKEIIENITQKGGSVPISLNNVDFNLVKINP